MAGREGLINTAVKTAETGYIQRQLVRCWKTSWFVMMEPSATPSAILSNLFMAKMVWTARLSSDKYRYIQPEQQGI